MQVSGKIEFTVTEQHADFVVAAMPVQAGILNPFGIVQAGALLWFADVSASVLVLQGREPTVGMAGFPLAINLNASLLANQSDGTLLARASFVKRGKTVSVVKTTVSGQDGRLMAEVTTTHIAAK
jgi:uncharacterized protein (TIGR00369 family)